MALPRNMGGGVALPRDPCLSNCPFVQACIKPQYVDQIPKAVKVGKCITLFIVSKIQ